MDEEFVPARFPGRDAGLPKPVVLVVDDEPDVGEEVVDCLIAAGCQAEHCVSSTAALAMLLARPDITVLLTDLRMPDIDGRELARRALEGRPASQSLAVVMMTGHGTLQTAVDAMRSGFIDFLTKPTPPDAIIAAVTRAHNVAKATRQASARIAEGIRHDTRRGGDGVPATSPPEGRNGVSRRFLPMLLHQLRSPLVPVMGFAEIIEQDCDHVSGADLARYAREITRGGEQLIDVISRISILWALQNGELSPASTPMRLSHVIESIITRRSRDAMARRVRVQSAGTDPGIFPTDEEMLTQILTELVANAIAASPPDGLVVISAAIESTVLTVVVSDQGPGIAPEEAALAEESSGGFDAPPAATSQGLGLVLAARLARIMGGRIALEALPARGTRARLELPAGGAA